MLRYTPLVIAALVTFSASAPVVHADPEQTVLSADQVLQEVMAIPAKQIPESLITQAQGIVIVPDVLKIGFVAGVRRGQGVVMVKDKDGEWTLPQFITLTGGSVGWQAGVQGSDVILVFMTQKSVEGLLRGKVTIGADAAASAGPVGRNAAAATDARLKAEILSYSRSRGLFAGLAIDGSVIEVDQTSPLAYYGAGAGQIPLHVPQSAAKLRQDLTAITHGVAHAPAAPGAVSGSAPPTRLMVLRQSLRTNAGQLTPLVDPSWQQYLALPREVFEGDVAPSLDSLKAVQDRYASVATRPEYKALAERPEFQATYETLREFTQEVTAATRARLALPPPPAP
ncbi:MAG: lipid-binding SYLF domain-containing protein [Planctomycetes bacterium]|nr:lipid-binding SYLF domain-containing protein [Planctomycetota bacterium]